MWDNNDKFIESRHLGDCKLYLHVSERYIYTRYGGAVAETYKVDELIGIIPIWVHSEVYPDYHPIRMRSNNNNTNTNLTYCCVTNRIRISGRGEYDLDELIKLIGYEEAKPVQQRTMNINDSSDLNKVDDVEVWGNPDTFTLISKVSSQSEGWMHSIRAMPCCRGVLTQTTTIENGVPAISTEYISGGEIIERVDDVGEVVERAIVSSFNPDRKKHGWRQLKPYHIDY